MIRIFIGWDPRQAVAFTTLAHSIVRTATQPVAITPLVLATLPSKREGLTPFTFSRFLVPWLCDFQGWALFLDADMMARADIWRLWAMRNRAYAVQLVKNRLRFEWASLMLFNCERCHALKPETIDTCEGLHSFSWLPPDQIGALPGEWNHLVGYDPPNPEARLVHFTQGLPVHPETNDSEFADEYADCGAEAMGTQSWRALMGGSVHAAAVLERLRASGATEG